MPLVFLMEVEFIWNYKRPQLAKTILKKNKAESIMLPNFKLYYTAIVIKTVLYCIQTHSFREQRVEKQTHVCSINM